MNIITSTPQMQLQNNDAKTNSVKQKLSYGFILSRHVTSQQTNFYWNLCIQTIRHFYPLNTIVVIDDNSNLDFVKETASYQNIIYVQSEFHGRGELLPFYYFYRDHYFDRAIIIHDSVFFQKKIQFDKIKEPILPIWHFENQRTENINNSYRLIQVLNNRNQIAQLLSDKDKYEVLTMNNNIWMGCFGCQCLINHDFLSQIQSKYNLFSLLRVVKTREDRCCLERIMGVIFFLESPIMKHSRIFSLLGPIMKYIKWGYTFDEYIQDHQRGGSNIHCPLIKIWTGR